MKPTQTVLTLLILIFTALPLHADTAWQSRAPIHVNKPGIMEAVLPPALFLGTGKMAGTDRIDLALEGPDGNRRAFELFWREPSKSLRFDLKTERMMLTDKGEFIWEGMAPKKKIETLYVTIRDNRFVGQVDVEAKGKDGWVLLAENAALFKSDGQSRAEIAITEGLYTQIRLRFRSFDREFEMKVLPVDRVSASGKIEGRDYAKEVATPLFQTTESGPFTELRTLLPGSGLFIETINLSTAAQFQGHWQVGREVIRKGKRTFVPAMEGNITTVSTQGNALSFAINRRWDGKSLVLKLNPQGRYLGALSELSVGLRLPRLLFSADIQGEYTAITGTGEAARIFPTPGSTERKIDQTLQFFTPVVNENHTELALTETYRLKGGPLNNEGFAWTADVNIETPGYYRLLLPMVASLATNRTGIRLSRGDTQVPFFVDRSENIELYLSVVPEYDKALNQTTWTLTLPQASPWWLSVDLTASGIFQRRVTVQTPKPGEMGWKNRFSMAWRNPSDQATTLKIPSYRLTRDQRELRIVMNHNDNEPLEINAIKAVYTAPSICFLAYEPGTLTLHGGHPDLKAPTYDLSLIQTKLMETLPTPIEAQFTTPVSASFWSKGWIKNLLNNGWGLYATLGVVALVLLVIIGKMLPPPEKEAE